MSLVARCSSGATAASDTRSTVAAVPDATDLTAYLTAILAALTYVMARSANQQAVAATAQAEAAKTQVEAAHRPVVVPFQKSAENVTFRGGQTSAGSGPQISENPPDRPDLPRYSAAFLPVENVGMGPALNVRGDSRRHAGREPHGSPRKRSPSATVV
jgi:hypothetical protein